MTELANSSGASARLEALLEDGVRALAALDLAALESLVESLGAGTRGRIAPPRSAAEWERAAAARWVLNHLLGETGRRLAMLRRLSAPEKCFGGYGGPAAQEPAPRPEMRPPGS